MKPISLILLTIAIITNSSIINSQIIEPVEGTDKLFTDYSTAWIANDGGYEESHIPHDMLNMFVRSDGTVATICTWDEGGTNVGIFRDGKLISRPEGSGTGGWGRFSGKAVVMDDQYVYQLLTQHGCDGGNNELNINGLPQFPPCKNDTEWKTIRRYQCENGKGTPFKNGYGYKGDMLVVCTEKERDLAGLAIDETRLYVAVTGLPDRHMPDSIKIYDKQQMSFISGYPLSGGLGLIYADNRQGLWMMRNDKIIRFNSTNGNLLPQQITIPPYAKVSSFSIDPINERLLLANCGKDMNILIYNQIYKQPVLVDSFGEKGGIFSQTSTHMAGETGEYRFCGPRGAGTDSKGNIYIANTFIGNGRGAIIEAYHEENKQFLWKEEGLIFTATADFDRSQPDIYYSPEKIHRLSPGIQDGRLDEVTAFTVNPFLYPDDERCRPDGPFITSTFKRTINGEDFLFVSDMYGGMLAGYRFDKKKSGYIAIPFLSVQNGNTDKDQPLSFWIDRNGDGKKQAEEYRNSKEINQYSMSFFVDQKGNIWKGTRGQGFQLWRAGNNNEHGIPQYTEGYQFSVPQGISDVKRIWYDSDNDELFLAGFSTVSPDSQDTWWSMGSTLVKYAHFMQRTGKGDTDTKEWTPDLSLYIPFHIKDGSGKDTTNAKAFAVAGDHIFIALARNGWITVYDRHTGKFTGRLEPGKEVHQQSGWCDFNYAINACRQEDGSYLILQEENAFGKILRYHLRTMRTE